MNVFRKCLKKEFGTMEYGRFVTMCHEDLEKNDPLNTDLKELPVRDKPVYKEMLVHVKGLTPEEIKKKKEALAGTLIDAFRIVCQFSFVFVFYIFASVLLIALELHHTVTCVSLALMGACFLYKTYEFVCNKFCFIDAYLVMVYKSVLEQVSD